ncbi:MAG: DoxX family protein [Streptosporangiales bacterium]|nr:DoxX family protein [Streptosporangiales bacterium]
MFTVHLLVSLLAAAVTGAAAIANLAGHDYPKRQADLIGVSHSWIRPLGVLLGLGALGLLAGLAVPALGALAAGGLVLYFIGAFTAHLRAGDRHFGPWSLYFTLTAAALVVNVANLAYPGS